MAKEYDMVNHPKHYQTKNGLEAIDVIEAFTADLRGGEATNTGNVLKYMCRWKHKNGIEDLKKARWYLDRLIELVEFNEKDNETEAEEEEKKEIPFTEDDDDDKDKDVITNTNCRKGGEITWDEIEKMWNDFFHGKSDGKNTEWTFEWP